MSYLRRVSMARWSAERRSILRLPAWPAAFISVQMSITWVFIRLMSMQTMSGGIVIILEPSAYF